MNKNGVAYILVLFILTLLFSVISLFTYQTTYNVKEAAFIKAESAAEDNLYNTLMYVTHLTLKLSYSSRIGTAKGLTGMGGRCYSLPAAYDYGQIEFLSNGDENTFDQNESGIEEYELQYYLYPGKDVDLSAAPKKYDSKYEIHVKFNKVVDDADSFPAYGDQDGVRYKAAILEINKIE